MDKRVLVSIIIPVKEVNDSLRQEAIPAILKQSYQSFELLIITDKKTTEKFPKSRLIPSWPKTGPADKRDLGAKKAKGEILAFTDDDAYPGKDWLKRAVKVFEKGKKVAAVCGPTLTPPDDNFRQKVSGYVWSTLIGSGGAGTYRYKISSAREVSDFPTANLLVRKKDFRRVGGFNTHYWSGEDTKLCFSLTKKLKKKIVYDPGVLVYHHRRDFFGPHLEQIARYALHRGHFAKIMPETSLRLGYLAPTFFAVGILVAPLLVLMARPFGFLYLLAVSLYLLAIFLTTLKIYWQERDKKLALLVGPAIFLTHFIYGIIFVAGFLAPSLKE